MRVLALSGLLFLSFVGAGCSHATRVRPTPVGTYELEAAVGGPMVEVGPVIPAPMSSVGLRYGIHPRGDIGAHLHITTQVFGVTGGDLDTSWRINNQDGWLLQLTAGARLYGFNKDGFTREYLELSPNVSWLYREHYLTYISATGLVQFHGGPVLFSAAAGEELRLGRFSLQAELRWYEPDYATRFVVVDWQPILGQGGWGVILAASYRFGGGA
ncbi:MAG: hypothetical protein IRZ16_21080 [Myxococcaceae bacterium]|nr:hypothetical protein [Myxococcaceae bacterium]